MTSLSVLLNQSYRVFECKACRQVFIRPNDLSEHQKTCDKYESGDGESSATSSTSRSTEESAEGVAEVKGKKPAKKYTFKPVASIRSRKRKVERTTPVQRKRRKSVEDGSVSTRRQSSQRRRISPPSSQVNVSRSEKADHLLKNRRASQTARMSTSRSTRASLRSGVQPADVSASLPSVEPDEPKVRSRRGPTTTSRKPEDQGPKAKQNASPSPSMEELVPETPEVNVSVSTSPLTLLKSDSGSATLSESNATTVGPLLQPSQTSNGAATIRSGVSSIPPTASLMSSMAQMSPLLTMMSPMPTMMSPMPTMMSTYSSVPKHDVFRSMDSLADGERHKYMHALRLGDYMCRYIACKDFADACIKTDLGDIPVHKVVLASKYPQLSSSLLSQDVLDLSSISYGHVSAWLKYVYTSDYSSLEYIPTEVLGQISRFLSSGSLQTSSSLSAPVTSTSTTNKTKTPATGKTKTPATKTATEVVATNKSASSSKSLPSKIGTAVGKRQNIMLQRLETSSPLVGTRRTVAGQGRDMRKLPSKTDSTRTTRHSLLPQQRTVATLSTKLSLAATKSKRGSNMGASHSAAESTETLGKTRSRNDSKKADVSSPSQPRRGNVGRAVKNKDSNSKQNVNVSRRQMRSSRVLDSAGDSVRKERDTSRRRPSLRQSKTSPNVHTNQDSIGDPQKRLTVSVLNLSHVSAKFPTKLSDWEKLLSPACDGSPQSPASSGRNGLVTLGSDFGTTVRSASATSNSISDAGKDNVDDNCKSNSAQGEMNPDENGSLDGKVEGSKVCDEILADTSSSQAGNNTNPQVDSNANNTAGEGTQASKTDLSATNKSNSGVDESCAPDISVGAIKLLSQHCHLVDLSTSTTEPTGVVVDLVDGESSGSEYVDVVVVDDDETAANAQADVVKESSSPSTDTPMSSTLNTSGHGQTIADPPSPIELDSPSVETGSGDGTTANMRGNKFHVSLISSIGEELPTLSDLEDDPVVVKTNVVSKAADGAAKEAVGSKCISEEADTDVEDNSTMVADDSLPQVVGHGGIPNRDTPRHDVDDLQQEDGKHGQADELSPPEHEVATSPKPRGTHKAYVPSPFTPMEDLQSLSDDSLKARLRGFGLRDKMNRKRMIQALTQIYVETHQYETDTSAEFTTLPTPDKGVELSLSHQSANDSDVVFTEPQNDNGGVGLTLSGGLKGKSKPKADGKDNSESDIDQLLGELDELIGSDDEPSANQTLTLNSSSSEGELSEEESDTRVIGGGGDGASPVDIDTTLRLLIKKNSKLYDRILRYEMIPQEELVELIKGEGLKCSLAALRSFCFKQCIPVQNKHDQDRRKRPPGGKKKAKKRAVKAPSNT